LAKLEIVSSYFFFFFCCFSALNSTATFQKQAQLRVAYAHLCCGHLDPGLAGAMTAAGMFDLEDSYLLFSFYLDFACVGCFAFCLMSGKCL